MNNQIKSMITILLISQVAFIEATCGSTIKKEECDKEDTCTWNGSKCKDNKDIYIGKHMRDN